MKKGDTTAADSKHPPVRLERKPIVQALRMVNIGISRFYHRTTIRAVHQLPRYGGGILVCNHVSGLDPLLIQSGCPRVIIWMMAKEYYDLQPLNWFYRQIHCIPVERSGRDLSATRAALRALQSGQILGVFPEGRIETDQSLLPFQTGVAMMAIKENAPIYPAYLDGTQRGKTMVEAFKSPNRADIAYGKPFRLSQKGTTKADLEAGTELIKQSIVSLQQKYFKVRSRNELG